MVDSAQYKRLREIGAQLIEALGEDVTRPGLRDTPHRFAAAWWEFANYDPGNIGTTFDAVAQSQMVVVSGMRVWSMCEHHLLPFWCDIAVAYIAEDKVLGLSKFARIAHKHAARLQIQEKLVSDIADDIAALTGSEDVAVLADGMHTCMMMRGIKTDGHMISSVMRGAFRDDAAVRMEFLELLQSRR